MANRYIKTRSTYLVTREMQIKTKMQKQCITIRQFNMKKSDDTKWKNVEQLEFSYAVDGIVKWYHHLGNSLIFS